MSNAQSFSGLPPPSVSLGRVNPLARTASSGMPSMNAGGVGTSINGLQQAQYNQILSRGGGATVGGNLGNSVVGVNNYPPMTVMGMGPPRMITPSQPPSGLNLSRTSSAGANTLSVSVPQQSSGAGSAAGLRVGLGGATSIGGNNSYSMYDALQQPPNGRIDMRSSEALPILSKSKSLIAPPEFDLSDFPALSSGSNSMGSGVSSSYPPSLPSEFTMHSEDFPALPGAHSYKSAVLSNDASSSMSSDLSYLPDMKSINMQSVYYGGSNAYSGSKGGIDGSLSDLNNGASKLEPSKQRLGTDKPKSAIAPPSGAFSSASSGSIGSSTSASTNPSSVGSVDRFGLLGLLGVIRMTEQDLNTLAIGSDLTTLGLNLNSPECLYATFASPWADGPSRREPEYRLPQCYYITPPNPLSKISSFSDETLFYIFYSMPRDQLQEAAAQQLYTRNWRFHKERKIWLTRDPSTELSEKTDLYERGTYIYFDVNTWEKVRKEFTLRYDMLEERAPQIASASTSTPSPPATQSKAINGASLNGPSSSQPPSQPPSQQNSQ